ncbi:hypothetical protein F5144DRAFT_643125 [Chaetomium tenue]|uniref:Uncharacterized protein n=1 Tax=Chaetomium tenue TaxID=1854479 RepID=A0ACB7PL09_9PEZI|nr:hypothetical protein F5144DRAFT_643125 [Chaetomium globosum]
MSPSRTTAINSSASFTSHTSDDDSTGLSIVPCSFTGCAAKIDGSRQILCEVHLQLFSKTDKNWDSGQANGTRATQIPTGASDPLFRPLSATNPRKLLPETDKDRPIMRRKTAGNPPQLNAQQPTPKHNSFPPSSRPLAPRPPADSPPESPGSPEDGEPRRKRQKLSPKPRVNGAVSFEPARSPQFSRYAPNLPFQAGKAREKEAKPGVKSAFRHLPLKRVPLQVSNLRFIGGPDEATSGVLSEQSSSGLNGFAGNAHRRSSEGSELSSDREMKDYFGRKTSSAASSTTLTESLDDTARFDALIYSQRDASSPPPGIDLIPTTLPPPPPPTQSATSTAAETPSQNQPQDEPLYLDIDPRIHWPQEHSAAWHTAKLAEIRARGNRKANFGRAAQSLRRQQREADAQAVPFEETLPEKMAENPAWVRALRRLRGLPLVGAGAGAGTGAGSASSASGLDEDWGGGGVNGADRKARKHGSSNVGGVTSKRVGNSGLVIVSGLNGAQMKSMRQLDGNV